MKLDKKRNVEGKFLCENCAEQIAIEQNEEEFMNGNYDVFCEKCKVIEMREDEYFNKREAEWEREMGIGKRD